MKNKLSEKQQKVLRFLIEYVKENGYAPSVRDICLGLNLTSTSTVHGYLCRLEEKGYIRRDPCRPRTIEILDRGLDYSFEQSIISLPVVGQVAAGLPIFAEENIEEIYHLPRWFAGNGDGETFVLNVIGNSMVNAGILSGDQIIVQRADTAENGEIVVAMVDNEATVKRFYLEDYRVRLHPENDEMEDMYFNEVTILGKVIGLMRKY